MDNKNDRILAVPELWATELIVAGNKVRQLLVPESQVRLEEAADGSPMAGNNFGTWPVGYTTAADDEPLVGLLNEDLLSSHLTWTGSRSSIDRTQVLESFRGAIRFTSHEEPQSLRRPQIGALHAVVGYWTSGLTEPGMVVMPTGTGKTETMLAVLVATRPERLLVIVPTAALRDQVAGKFERLGVLQREGIVAPTALRPIVGRLEHALGDIELAHKFADPCNVVVATPAALHACSDEVKIAFLDSFSHLIVDEAHHSPALTWRSVIGAFGDRQVLLFTATPFREDGRSLPGRVIYRFPLREAQRDGYFTHIDYKAVLTLNDVDLEVAQLAIARLRDDIARGYDHIAMARTGTVEGAKRLLAIYENIAPEFGPRLVHEKIPSGRRREFFEALESRACRVVVCVDMLGEGFDLPALKVGAIHESRRSLGPMVQLIGRFTRNPSDDQIGTAAVFVARDPSAALSPLRDLMREDADWNHILNDVTERASERAEDLKAFDESFVDVPDDIPVNLLQPKVSAVAYETPSRAWRPENALDLYDVDSVIGGRVSIGGDGSIGWFVTRETQTVRWGRIPGLAEDAYELILMYFDRDHQMLYIHGSNKEGTYRELAEAVAGEGVDLVRGTATFRVLAGVDRLIPSNVGLLDVRDRRKRFTLVTGSDVNEALDVADGAGKSQTHIVTSGFENGERVTISAALSGRFWSMRSADGLKAWIDWCDVQGSKLRDRSIDLSKLFSRLIIPTELVERPNQVLLALDWPWQTYAVAGGGRQITFSDKSYDLLDVELRVDDYGTQGPFRFSFVTPDWEVPYLIEVGAGGLTFAPVGDDADTRTRGDALPLHEWIQRHKLNLFLSGDRMIEGDRYYESRSDIEPYDRDQFTVLAWPGVNIRKESQGTHRDCDSIQAFISKWLREHHTFDVLIDDDRAGEAADLVGLQIVENELHVTLVHCKYSTESTPGARVKDLYEVCGQAVRSAKWRQNGVRPLLQHLTSRARKYYSRNRVSPFEVGQIEDLTRIQEVAVQVTPVFHVIVAQPGLSAEACSSDQLLLIAGADAYVRQTTKGDLTVVCSR